MGEHSNTRTGEFRIYHISTSPVFYSSYRRWVDKTTFNEKEFKAVVIEDDVLISANVTIINGVHVGRGAVIGAGAVVNLDVPPYAIVAGVPAKVIKYRFPQDVIDKIEASRWWEKDDSILKELIGCSSDVEEFVGRVGS